MTSRERVLLALDHQEADRVAIHDSPWATTISRWHTEGLPEGVGPGEYFNYEFASQGFDASARFPTEVIEETEEYKIVKDANGAIRKDWKHRTSTPELLGFTISTRRAWQEHRERFLWSDDRVDWENALAHNRKLREGEKFVTFNSAFGYDRMAMVVGPESLLMAMVEDPEWVKDVFKVSSDICIAALEEMTSRGFVFDACFMYDDLGYKHRPFFSPAFYRELLMPAHKAFCDAAHSKGLKVILHSCGNVNQHVPSLIEAGFDCLQPLEVKAGMDLLQLKQDYGEVLSFMGGIDVRAMAHPDPKIIEEEIRAKVPVAKRGGGYIYHSDHSVPDNVSFEQYKRVIELVLHYGRQ